MNGFSVYNYYRRHNEMLTYDKCEAQLQGRNRASRKLANNTYLHRHGSNAEPDSFAVRLHNTDIMLFRSNGDVILDVGPWQTITTKERLNRYLPYGWRLWQERSIWFLSRDGVTVGYANNMMLHADGTVSDAEDVEAKKLATRKLLREIKNYAERYVDALFKGEVPAPGAGDCWFCLMFDTKEHPTTDHIVSHMSKEENYFVPSMLVRAIEAKPVSPYAQQALSELWTAEQKPEAALMERLSGRRTMHDIAREQLRKSLVSFLKTSLGVAQ